MNLNIAVLPGDGIGPEIMEQAIAVTNAIANKFGHKVQLTYAICGADAIDKVGNPYPNATHDVCMSNDAVLFGAIGHPKYDNNPTATVRPEQGLLAMRKKLGLYANIRPVKAFETILSKSPLREELVRDTDFIVIRELTGGIYFGQPRGISEDGNTAIDTCAYSREEIERIIQLAYTFAQKRRRKVTVVDKANILATSQLWRKIAQEIAPKHHDITTEYLFVDNAAMQLIQNPKTFDVLVTENMFGDILTDEASVITGSLGMLPSASIGLHTSVFEPIHGSYPQAAGKNIANPIAMVLSAALMFEYAFNLNAESQLIRQAVDASIANGIVTTDIASDKSYTTTEVGQWLVNYINKATI